MVKGLVLIIIRIYQKTLSYDHGLLGKMFPNVRYCKFTPSCSMYMYDAVKKYGVLKGIPMGINRLGRCNVHTPMGTYDPVK